eukprot:TRINITY_DN36398_c0_g1_i1.p1 TRINITY_DN36398_c0_g1~~TRINITY_DN36398_c0_g1_i1.p1  ORF type:complete len:425 (+),score=98.05 TRINITY_DN36398_c0_g1_i1:103-1377(+)
MTKFVGPAAAEDVDFYQILGVPHDATVEQIRRAYKRLALEWHPDKCGRSDSKELARAASSTLSEGSVGGTATSDAAADAAADGLAFEERDSGVISPEMAEEHFKKVSEAYRVLSDPQRRTVYDFRRTSGMCMMDGFKEPEWWEASRMGADAWAVKAADKPYVWRTKEFNVLGMSMSYSWAEAMPESPSSRARDRGGSSPGGAAATAAPKPDSRSSPSTEAAAAAAQSAAPAQTQVGGSLPSRSPADSSSNKLEASSATKPLELLKHVFGGHASGSLFSKLPVWHSGRSVGPLFDCSAPSVEPADDSIAGYSPRKVSAPVPVPRPAAAHGASEAPLGEDSCGSPLQRSPFHLDLLEKPLPSSSPRGKAEATAATSAGTSTSKASSVAAGFFPDCSATPAVRGDSIHCRGGADVPEFHVGPSPLTV